jgi:hypothetical protein
VRASNCGTIEKSFPSFQRLLFFDELRITSASYSTAAAERARQTIALNFVMDSISVSVYDLHSGKKKAAAY